MGHLGTSRPTLGGEILKTVKHGASEVFNMLNQAMSVKKSEQYSLKQILDWKTSDDDST